jgi:putative methionine-R-sulfoxide reductase with GAF domain
MSLSERTASALLSLETLFTIRRRRMIFWVTLVMMVFFAIYSGFIQEAIDGAALTLLQRALIGEPFSLIALVSIYGIGTLTLIGLAFKRDDLSAFGPPLMWLGSGMLLAVGLGYTTYTGGALSGASLLILSGLMLGTRGLIGGYIVAVIAAAAALSRRGALSAEFPDLINLTLQYTGLALLVYLYNLIAHSQTAETARRAAADQARLIAIAGSIAQQISQRRSLDEVLTTAVEQIVERYPGIYHAQIFLIDDESGEARLRASTGEAGRLLLQRRHSLPVGSRSVIGQVTAYGEPVISRASDPTAPYRPNELLPNTQVEMAFPLRMSGRVIGALDLQSLTVDGIRTEDAPVFQLLADAIAVAIDNGELFELTQRRLEENQRLIAQLTQAVSEVERLNRQYTQTSWANYLEVIGGRAGVEVVFQRRGGAVHALTSPWREPPTPIMADAVSENSVIQRPSADGISVAVPMRVRGQIVGALELSLPDRAPLTDDEMALLLDLTDRFGALADTLRADDERRRLAEREALLSSIGARLQSTYDIDALLSEAARGLQSALGAPRVAIRLGKPGKPDSTSTNGRNGA